MTFASPSTPTPFRLDLARILRMTEPPAPPPPPPPPEPKPAREDRGIRIIPGAGALGRPMLPPAELAAAWAEHRSVRKLGDATGYCRERLRRELIAIGIDPQWKRPVPDELAPERLRALWAAHGTVRGVAKALGRDPSGVSRRLRALGVQPVTRTTRSAPDDANGGAPALRCAHHR